MDLVERLPAELWEGEVLSGLDGPLEGGGPHAHRNACVIKGQRQAVKKEVGQNLGVLPTLLGDARVPSQKPLHIVLRLAVAAEPDLAGSCHSNLADLHKIEHNLAWNVPTDAVDVHVPAPRHHVDHLDVVDVAVGDGLVNLIVAKDPVLEVGHCLLHVHPLIVRAEHHLVAVVGLQDGRVIANALEEQVLPGPVKFGDQHPPALLGRVGSIKNSNLGVFS
mmetsp:Transcript_33363/g.94526  ORF Transcript_33363/g.94526 Transcript_33363/m.94526 type:complete len:220 (+) Transcript_33363:864-1523(+)